MTADQKPILQVAAKAAIINPEGQVLIVREAATDKNNTKVGEWGLVGGRLNLGESFSDGLKREISEETGLEFTSIKPLYIGEWHPVIRGVPYQIVAIFMLCKTKSRKVQLSLEHDRYEWIDPAKRSMYPIMEPDCFAVDELTK